MEPVTESESDNTKFDLKTNEEGIVSVSGLSQGKYRFIEQSIEGNTPTSSIRSPLHLR